MSRFVGSNRLLSRRHVLRGAGVALALPWLESLQPRSARAQQPAVPLRFIPVYLPNGAPDLWKPAQVGAGDAWALSSLLAPLLPIKARTTVISGLENGSVFNADGSASVEPAHARQAGAWLTCQDAAAVRQRLGVVDANGVSVDQLIAAHPSFAGTTRLPSLSLGLATCKSDCGTEPCSLSSSISWASETEPLYKRVDPKAVFELLTGLAQAPEPSEAAKKRRLEDLSVLDSVGESVAVVRPKLSTDDRLRLDSFLSSVRELEKLVEQGPLLPGCSDANMPFFLGDLSGGQEFRQNSAGYSRDQHARAMNELIVLALRCNSTRVISYMLDDENSPFAFDHLQRHHFDQTGSTPVAGSCGPYAAAHEANDDDYATITHWHVQMVADLCRELADTPEGDGSTMLDNTVVFVGGGMHGTNHQCADLPALLIGGGAAGLKLDQHLALQNRPLRDLYFTLMNGAYDLGVTDFGANRTGAPLALIEELLS